MLTIDRVVDNVDTEGSVDAATPEHGVALGRIYARLNKANTDHAKALSEYRKAMAVWNADGDWTDMELTIEETGRILTRELRDCRPLIHALPTNTTAEGGANRQTVVFQFYGPVNREGKRRMTSAYACKVNAASFSG